MNAANGAARFLTKALGFGGTVGGSGLLLTQAAKSNKSAKDFSGLLDQDFAPIFPEYKRNGVKVTSVKTETEKPSSTSKVSSDDYRFLIDQNCDPIFFPSDKK